MKKPLLIIVEGAQGSGKTTISNYLRENITSTNLFRLSGCKSNDVYMPYKYHGELLKTCLKMGEMGIDNNIVFDRSFLSEWCYRLLGVKNEDITEFNDCGWALSGCLDDISKYYTVILMPLYLHNTSLYIERLKRDKPTYNNAIFAAENSIKQQETYLALCNNIVGTFPDIKCMPVDTSETSLENLVKLLEVCQ